MTIIQRITITFLLYTFSYIVNAGLPPQCSTEANVQAKKLLAFHYGINEGIEIDPDIKALAFIRNPANKKQQFAVLEVWGYIYKAQYRMRFMYYRPVDKCILMGQEILEFAKM